MTAPTRPLIAVAAVVVLLVAGIGGLAATLPDDRRADGASRTDTGAGTDWSDLDALHDGGITGENVSVGVVDVTGFDRSAPALSDQVVDARAFGPGATLSNGGRTTHGTATATTVARIAPDADVYLAPFEGRDGYRRAVEWLVDSGVDVVVAPVSFYGKPGDGSANVSRVATRAVAQGVVFVAPAGNLGRSHWSGAYDRVRDGARYFGDDPRRELRGDGDRVSVWLSWDRDRADEDYTVELYARDGERTRLVARSQRYPGDGVPNERIVADVSESDSYFVVVRGPENATGTRLRLSSPTHRLSTDASGGSVVAPAAGKGVVGVGAYDPVRERVEPFSSRGPTADGRLGVDVVASDRHPLAGETDRVVGSSASAPVVGGVVALVVQTAPGLSPRVVEHVVELGAVDVGPAGTDPAAGHGLVRPAETVRVAANATD